MLRSIFLMLLAAVAVALAQAPASSVKPAAPTRSAPTLQSRPGESRGAPKQATPTQANPQQVANQLASAHQSWGPSMGTAIASASLREVVREGAVYTYHLFAAGMPAGRLYNIVAWPVNQPRPVDIVKGVALDAAGMAICPGKLGACGSMEAPNEPVNLSITTAPGRPVRVGIVAQDATASAYTKMVPVPLRGVDKGCTIEAVMLTQSGSIALIEGSGFPPNSEIDMQLINNGQRSGGKSRVDEKGTYTATVIPAIDGASNGTMQVNVTSAQCNPALSFEWGLRLQPVGPAGAATPAPPTAPGVTPPPGATQK